MPSTLTFARADWISACIFMPEKGWAILTIWEDTTIRVEEEAYRTGLIIDEFINHLMDPDIKEWSLCGIY